MKAHQTQNESKIKSSRLHMLIIFIHINQCHPKFIKSKDFWFYTVYLFFFFLLPFGCFVWRIKRNIILGQYIYRPIVVCGCGRCCRRCRLSLSVPLHFEQSKKVKIVCVFFCVVLRLFFSFSTFERWFILRRKKNQRKINNSWILSSNQRNA